MNLKQFANVDSFLRDLDTGMQIPHEEYMTRVIEKLGLNNIKLYIPVSVGLIREKLKEDKHLNNIPLSLWDEAAGYISYINRNTKTKEFMRRHGLCDLLIRNGITCFSVSECVSILKEAAREVCDE